MVALPAASHDMPYIVACKSFFEELNLFFKLSFSQTFTPSSAPKDYCRLEASTSKSNLVLTVDSGICYAKVTISLIVYIEFIEQSVIILPF